MSLSVRALTRTHKNSKTDSVMLNHVLHNQQMSYYSLQCFPCLLKQLLLLSTAYILYKNDLSRSANGQIGDDVIYFLSCFLYFHRFFAVLKFCSLEKSVKSKSVSFSLSYRLTVLMRSNCIYLLDVSTTVTRHQISTHEQM